MLLYNQDVNEKTVERSRVQFLSVLSEYIDPTITADTYWEIGRAAGSDVTFDQLCRFADMIRGWNHALMSRGNIDEYGNSLVQSQEDVDLIDE